MPQPARTDERGYGRLFRYAAGAVLVRMADEGARVPLVIAGVFTDPYLIGTLFVLAGAANGMSAAAVFVLRHRHATARVRSQAFTLAAGLKITGSAAGAALAGAVAASPTALQLAIAGSAPIIAGAVGLVAIRRVRT